MNICIDVGNSTIGIGVFDNHELVGKLILNTDVRLTEDEFHLLFKARFDALHIDRSKIKHVIFLLLFRK